MNNSISDNIFNNIEKEKNNLSKEEQSKEQSKEQSEEEQFDDNNKDLKKEIITNGYDYYAILGFTNIKISDRPKIDLKTIKEAYNKKIRICHPDYIQKNISKEELISLQHMFKLVQLAGQVLTNKEKKIGYDLKITTQINGITFQNRKEKFKEFVNLQEQVL